MTDAHKKAEEIFELIEGLTVSMDVSTGEDDSTDRVFGKVYEVQVSGGDIDILAIEENRNFAPPAISIDWIPVAGRWPPDDKTVLIHMPSRGEPVWLGWYKHAQSTWYEVDGMQALGVTHWAKMPQGAAA